MNGLFEHYYGDTIRILFLVAGFIMLISFPFVQQRIPVPLTLGVLVILALDVFAGITNPLWEWVSYIDASLSFIGFLWFSYFTLNLYQQYGVLDYLFWLNGILAAIFFFALYFATKTLRGKFAV